MISTNLGRAIDAVFRINVKRVFPDGTSMDYLTKMLLYTRTLFPHSSVNLEKGIGLNSFTIWLDSYGEITELSELNNSTTVSLNIKSNDITPVYPYEYAIIPSWQTWRWKHQLRSFRTNKKLYFSTRYHRCLHPSISYKSNKSCRRRGYMESCCSGNNRHVYFWRCSLIQSPTVHNSWRGSSFQYIKGKRGWGQAHFFQFNKDDYQYVKLKTCTRSSCKWSEINIRSDWLLVPS